MSSEDRSNGSDLNSDLGSEDGEWVPKREAAFREGVSERTIETRVAHGFYQSRLIQGRREIFLKNRKPDPKTPKNGSDQTFTPSEGNSELPPNQSRIASETLPMEVMNKMLELADRVLQQSQEIVQVKTELEQKKTELVIMNNERVSYNTSLQRAKDDRKEIEALRAENETLKKKFSEKPKWWSFS